MKLKWNRKLSILVLIMFVTVTFASFNTNLFINGNAYVRVDRDIRITNIHLLETEYNGYENTNSEYTNHSISTDVSLPRQASSVTYEVTISNVSDRRYKISDIIEDSYDNKDVKYELIDASIGNIVEPHTTKTFKVKFTNNVTVIEEDDVYQTLTYTFDYTGDEQEFIVPFDGDYTLEVWGAQGGNAIRNDISFRGGYGGYSKGTIHLSKNQILFVYVGGKPENSVNATLTYEGGYNGGGTGDPVKLKDCINGAGGGATHITTAKGLLSHLENKIDNIILVAGGGGGGAKHTRGDTFENGLGGSGGGYVGSSGTKEDNIYSYGVGTGGSQTAGGTNPSSKISGTFGHGGEGILISYGFAGGSGGGGGYYGGATGYTDTGAGGGSGYIGNSNLTNKVMYCYQCQESNDTSTKTVATNNHSLTPTSEYAKEGNGYAKLTVTRKIEDGSEYDFEYTGTQQTFVAPYSGLYQLETWGAQGGTDKAGGRGGYGGYSKGLMTLEKNQQLYVTVGGMGSYLNAGYNGGGVGQYGGGGATNITTTKRGILPNYENYINEIIMVSGGGGGNDTRDIAGDGGGFKGTASSSNTGQGGTQTEGGLGLENGSFGQGGANSQKKAGAGGGGFYGGGSSTNEIDYGGGGGSGYIGNSSLTNKVMYCYNCQESQSINTRTISTKSHNKNPRSYQAKEGNGYSKITLLKRTINQTKLTLDFTFEEYVNENEYTFGYTGSPQEFIVPKTGYYEIELWGASGNNNLNNYTKEEPSYGAYTSGKIKLNKGEIIYVYVGGQRKAFNCTSAQGEAGSGGATDIRLKTADTWNSLDSLSSRIMVAGGAGGSYVDSTAPHGSSAGGLVSYPISHPSYSIGSATQTSSGTGASCPWCNSGDGYYGNNGSFGYGGDAKPSGWYNPGGGGYYGGGGGPAGGGGSSFISGHNGCVAITAESDTTPRNDSNGNQCADGTTDITCSKHYSNYVFEDTHMIDGKGYEWTTQVGTQSVGMPTHDGTTTMTGNDGDGFAKITCLEETTDYLFDFTGQPQDFVAPYNGIYKVELWGAAGGGSTEGRGNLKYGGHGAYTSGYIELDKNKKLYVYVGEFPSFVSGNCNQTNNNYSFNGTLNGTCSGGGGATDIRLVKNETWNNSKSLASRIIVAAGGGGSLYGNLGIGGAGGGLKGQDGTGFDENWTLYDGHAGVGGTQTGNYFGYGGQVTTGGGGGYYGGDGGSAGNAGGGSSYISGYKGCIAITAENNLTPICTEENDPNDQDISCSYHYSGYKFENGVMIDGTSEMPSPDGRTTVTGNTGNGYARITLIEKVDTYKISYDLDGGTITKPRKSYSNFDDDITLGTPTKEGYDFVGWTGGKNLFNQTEFEANIVTGLRKDDNGNIVEDEVSNYSTYMIKIKKNKKYKFYGWLQAIYLYDDNKQFINRPIKIPNHNYIMNEEYTPTIDGYIQIQFRTDKYPLYKGTEQIEEGNELTTYESYISSPTTNITIPNGSTGNRTYHAIWTPRYTIEYDLDGGTISNVPNTYNKNSNSITIPEPTKTDYYFMGWTGGKNLLRMKNSSAEACGVTLTINNNEITINGTTTCAVSARYDLWKNNISFNVTEEDSYYYKFTNSIDGGNYGFYKGEDLTTYTQGTVLTPGDHYFGIYLPPDKTYNNFKTKPMVEKGYSTEFEDIISTPTKNITIPSGSKGNRHYTAVWKRKVRLDVNTYLNGTYDDNMNALVRFDVYVDGIREYQQVTDYAQYKPEGTTFEITNITYDTSKYNMSINRPSGTIPGDTTYYGINIYLTDKNQ